MFKTGLINKYSSLDGILNKRCGFLCNNSFYTNTNKMLSLARSFQRSSYKTTPVFAMTKNRIMLNNNRTPMVLSHKHALIQQKRYKISIIPLISRAFKLPIYIGSGMAAMGSYLVYKLDEGTVKIKDSVGKAVDWLNDAFDGVEWPNMNKDGSNSSNGNNNNNGDGGEILTGAVLLAGMPDEDSLEKDLMDKEYLDEDEDAEDETEGEDTTGDDMVSLTRQMIEIRGILNKISSKMGESISLPAIVVIGSQSSGKSSVLESIVGKDFLPKGDNMVTRRPIELTLINTKDNGPEENHIPQNSFSKKSKLFSSGNEEDYLVDFPQLREYNISSFTKVKRLLIDMNLQVSSKECISEEAIQLVIKSSKVPDLQLIDLPGYIQIESIDQPAELKEKIKNLCNKYLQKPNIILAISSADVDLANSTALKASRVMDPKGERTLGVITKLDLVQPGQAAQLLLNKKYPLKMGYVGVVNNNKKTTENEYFQTNKLFFKNCQFSNRKLRKKLITILEMTMSKELKPTFIKLQQELDSTSYRFKVEFNDRQLTPRTYLLSQIDVLKLAVKELQDLFSRNELKSILRQELDQEVLNILASRYWKDLENENVKNIVGNTSDEAALSYWHKNLELSTSSLTKLGIGRLTTSIITNSILSELNNILFVLQPSSYQQQGFLFSLVNDIAIQVLNKNFYSTADQVENCIKPFKYEVEIEQRDWDDSKNNTVFLLKEELKQVEQSMCILNKSLSGKGGNKQLQQLLQFLKQSMANGNILDVQKLQYDGGFSKMLLEKGKQYIDLEKREQLLKFRLKFINGKQCRDTKAMDKCPEIYLKAINEKLISTAVLFLNIELLSDFFYNFPIELDSKISELSIDDIEMFAKQDSKISKHIDLQKRKDLLELALNKMNNLLLYEKINKKQKKSL